ncbi:MAG: hypothetical protein AAGB26_07385 [Planctomycetota bacterium]
MLRPLASHTTGPLEGIHLYYYEVQGLFIAFLSLGMLGYALVYAWKKHKAKSGAS